MSDLIEIIKNMNRYNLASITKKTIWTVVIITIILSMFFGMTIALEWKEISIIIFIIIVISWIILFGVVFKKELYPRTRKGLMSGNLPYEEYKRIREEHMNKNP